MLPPRPSTLDTRPSFVPSPSTLDPHPSFPLVTIAIPTYNRADSYLPQALKCAFEQTYANLEIIVADNCSTDNTKAFVTGYANPRRLRYFRHDANLGATGNFNFCVEQAKGKYLLILHDDDVIDSDFVESCIQASNGKPDAGIIRMGTRLINSRGDVLTEIPNLAADLSIAEFFRGWFSHQTTIYLCSTLFNTQRLKEIGGFKSKHNCYDDTIAIVRLAVDYGRIDVPKVKASARIHDDKMGFATNINEWCEDSLELLNLMCELVPNHGDELRCEGLRFFARANYQRASAMNSRLGRCFAYGKVCGYFGYRYLPSFQLLLGILEGTPIYNALRFVKRNLTPAASRS